MESGQLAYPYSTRELVKLVAHAQRFPRDATEEVAATVFAFDLADQKKRTPLMEVLQRHGIATTEAEKTGRQGKKTRAGGRFLFGTLVHGDLKETCLV